MSDLILPNGHQKRPPRRKASDLATIGVVVDVAANMVGPLSIIVQELMQKVARLEDRLGITDESIAGESRPVGTTYGECGLAVAVPPEVTVGPQFNDVEHARGGDLE